MKKVMIMLVAVIMFTACGNPSKEVKPVTKDSTVTIDSSSVGIPSAGIDTSGK